MLVRFRAQGWSGDTCRVEKKNGRWVVAPVTAKSRTPLILFLSPHSVEQTGARQSAQPSAVGNVGSLSSIPILSSQRNEIAESGRRGEYVYLSGLPDCWLPPDNIYANSDWQREEIATNLQEGLRFLGVVFEVA